MPIEAARRLGDTAEVERHLQARRREAASHAH
jgi:hypothetical protein